MSGTVTLSNPSAKTLDDIDFGLDLRVEIKRLCAEKNAIILAHYYQDGEIQDLADFVGDSLDLSRKAAATNADMILFSGVTFMAEVAKILSPNKTVIVPDADAGCSLEDSCQTAEFKAWRDAHPDHISLTYVNCSAEVKALSDVIVTSSSAEHIINNLPKDQPILFAPDRHLGAFLKRKTGRDDMVLWPGTCIVHEQFSAREISRLKTRNPTALVASHPECPDSIVEVSDYVGSTSGILNFVNDNPATTFIVATEQNILHQMEKDTPNKTFLAAPGADGSCNCAICPYMALNTLEKIYLALVNEGPRVEMPEDLRMGALKPLERMLELAPTAKSDQNAA
ncbi:MAG: quinolinate synthase NadA [Magnetovibrio sp.]|nr:quinolinate synthase NadA [Magnetovibrio sp.]